MIELENDVLRLVTAPVFGGAIRRLDAKRGGGVVPLMRPTEGVPPTFNHTACYAMAPWVNRIHRGRFEWAGREHRLTDDWDDQGGGMNAIHGEMCRGTCQIVEHAAEHVAMRFDSREAGARGERVEWPWDYACTITHTLAGASLTIGLSLENRSGEPMPAGLGLHPYFLRDLGAGEELILQAAASEQFLAPWLIPTGETRDTQLMRTFRAGAPAADISCDASFTRAAASEVDSPDPLLPESFLADLRWPKAGVHIRLSASDAYTQGHVFTRSPTDEHATSFEPPLPFIAVEPQTSCGNAVTIGQGSGLRVLEPGGTLDADFTVSLMAG